MNMIFMGAPGVGKGTQADFVAQQYGLQHVSTGDLLRKAVSHQSPLGIQAGKYMNQGLLVPDGVMIDLVEDVLKPAHQKSQGFILDGFPRTVPQAESLDKMLEASQIQLHNVVIFVLPEEELVKRVTGRRVALRSGRIYHLNFRPSQKEGICDETGEKLVQREDDKEEVVRERLREYESKQESLTQYYKNKRILTEISASGSMKEVRDRLEDWLKKV